jgi:hypothetical protein
LAGDQPQETRGERGPNIILILSKMRGRAASRGNSTGGGRKRSRSTSKADQNSGDGLAVKLEEGGDTSSSVGDAFMTKLGDGSGRGSDDGDQAVVTYPRNSLPPLRKNKDKKTITGYVRTTPPGHMISDDEGECDDDKHEAWNKFRLQPSRNGIFPKEGFDHILGESEIREVDGVPIGGRIDEIDGPYTSDSKGKSKLSRGNHDLQPECCLDPEEEEALQAELSQRRADLAHSMMEDDGVAGALLLPVLIRRLPLLFLFCGGGGLISPGGLDSFSPRQLISISKSERVLT